MNERKHVLIAPIDYISKVAYGGLHMVAHFPTIEIMYADKLEFDGEAVVLTSNTYKFCTQFPTKYLVMVT